MQIKHLIQVKDSKIKFLNPTLFKQDLAQYEGQEINLTISRRTSIRSDNQNRYYWGVVLKIISDELGYFPDEIHEILRSKFLAYPIQVKTEVFDVALSTTRLTTKEFEEYLSQIRIWASSELSIFIPEPNEID